MELLEKMLLSNEVFLRPLDLTELSVRQDYYLFSFF